MSLATMISRSFSVQSDSGTGRSAVDRSPSLPAETKDRALVPKESARPAPSAPPAAKLIDYFPSEIVAFYTALLGLPFIEGIGIWGLAPKIVLYLVSLVLTLVLAVVMAYRKDAAHRPKAAMRERAKCTVLTAWRPAAIACAAFSLWAFALPDSGLQVPVLGGIIEEGQTTMAATAISGAIGAIIVVLWRPGGGLAG